MAFSQVKDVLKRAVEFHKMLEDFYLKIENMSQKESVKLLVNYMARHERILEGLLDQVTAEQQQQITKEWLKYEPDFANCKCFEDIKIDKDSEVDDVIDSGLLLNQCLIDLYHQMAEIAPTKEIRNLFSNLETMEISEKKKLARMKGM